MIECIYFGYAIDIMSKDVLDLDPNKDKLYEVGEIPIIGILSTGTICVQGSWMITPLYSTSYFNSRYLDCPQKLTHGQVYYSLDKSKCEKFVTEHKLRNNNYIDKICQLKSK